MCECGQCKKCKQREWSRQYRERYPERVLETARRSRQKDGDAAARRYRQRYPDRVMAAQAKYRESHREERRDADRERQANRRASRRDEYNAEARARRAANPEHYAELERARWQRDKRKRTDQKLRKAFGISIDQYEAMHDAQGGVCAICGEPERAIRNGTLTRLAVDHCHETGRIRGLLCSRCNPMIGYAKHNPTILRAAIAYLKRC